MSLDNTILNYINTLSDNIKSYIARVLSVHNADNTAHQSLFNEWLSEVYDVIYPVGSIYISANSSFNPNNYFDGTWELIENKFLLGSENGQGIGTTGGEASHTLTINEMPSHNHTTQLYGHKTNGGVSGKHRSVWSGNNDMAPTTWIDNTGGGQAHNNMPPYLVVNIWKRTA